MAKILLQARFTPGNDAPGRLRQPGKQRKLGVLTLLLLPG